MKCFYCLLALLFLIPIFLILLLRVDATGVREDMEGVGNEQDWGA